MRAPDGYYAELSSRSGLELYSARSVSMALEAAGLPQILDALGVAIPVVEDNYALGDEAKIRAFESAKLIGRSAVREPQDALDRQAARIAARYVARHEARVAGDLKTIQRLHNSYDSLLYRGRGVHNDQPVVISRIRGFNNEKLRGSPVGRLVALCDDEQSIMVSGRLTAVCDVQQFPDDIQRVITPHLLKLS